MSAARVMVLGAGNPYRGDDGAGLAVAARLEGRTPPGVAVLTCEQEPSRLIDAWDGAAAAVVVDAASSGAAPGTVTRFDASRDPVPAGVFRSSTHAFGVSDAIELARALGTLPPHVVVYAVEGESFAAGLGLTATVEAAVGEVVDSVLLDLRQLTREEGTSCTSAH
jgi:hydrogenase maturation protease